MDRGCAGKSPSSVVAGLAVVQAVAGQGSVVEMGELARGAAEFSSGASVVHRAADVADPLFNSKSSGFRLPLMTSGLFCQKGGRTHARVTEITYKIRHRPSPT